MPSAHRLLAAPLRDVPRVTAIFQHRHNRRRVELHVHAWNPDAPDALRLRRLGSPELRFPHGPPATTGATRTWASRGGDGASIEVWLEDQRCIDSMSGARFAYRARVRLGQESWLGCAREGGA